MTFDVEVVLRGRDRAVSIPVAIAHGAPAAWDEAAVRDVLVEVLRAVGRAENPATPADRPVVLRGFSWIVQPSDGQVVIAIEIPMGAAVAGPFAIDQAVLDGMITRVLREDRAAAGFGPTIH